MLTTLGFLESPMQLAVVALIALLIFGHTLPQLAKSMGMSVSAFKQGVREGEQQEPSTPPAPPAVAEKK